jgi:hydrogenase-4 component B
MASLMTPLSALLGTWSLDALGAAFAVPTVLLVVAAAAYAVPYLRQERFRRESALRFWLCYALFAAGMLGALAAWDLVQFVVAWEVMTLASYVLVAHETSEPGAVRAAFKYFVMTHAASACLLLAVMLLWAQGGSLGFDALRPTFARLAGERPLLLHAVLALLFIGFATKAGLYPLGDWLPDAHPAAPAPVSAVLSGIMVKVGLYGFLRFFVWALATADPQAAVIWGFILAVTGAVSALIGGLAACAATDSKVLLAYSSIAQSGLVSVGVGTGMALMPGSPALAQLALLGALFHAVSDAAVKGLLFFAAGSLQYRTGSRRLEDLGGLFQAMPATAWTALVATLAIAGFPPLTAFTGKWLLLQSTVLSGTPVLVGLGLALLLASVLSILYALKFFAAGFLVRPMRTGVDEVPGAMRAAQLALAVMVLALGLLPGLWLARLGEVVVMLGAPPPPAPVHPAAWLGFGPPSGAYAPVLLVVVGAWVALLARAALGPARAGVPRRVPVWMGGAATGPGPAPINALGFFVPLREAMRHAYPSLRFRALALPRWIVPAVNADRWLYRPAARAGLRVGAAMQDAHTGTAHRYIVWQLVGALTLIAVLVLARP